MLRLGTVIVTIGASVALLPYLTGAVARVLVPELDSADQAIPALTRLVLNDWGGALFLAGVVAAGMSTFAGVLVLTAFSWAVIASTNLWPLLFGIYWRRTSPRATYASMLAGVSAALIWQAWPRLTWLPELPPQLAGIHGFVVGTAVGLVVILVGTLVGQPAPRRNVDRAWGSSRPGS